MALGGFAFKKGEIKEFERHSRLGFVDHAGFLKEVARLRKIGFKRIKLKTIALRHSAVSTSPFTVSPAHSWPSRSA